MAEYFDYKELKSFYTMKDAAELIGLSEDELKKTMEAMDILQDKDPEGHIGLRREKFCQVHQYVYRNERGLPLQERQRIGIPFLDYNTMKSEYTVKETAALFQMPLSVLAKYAERYGIFPYIRNGKAYLDVYQVRSLHNFIYTEQLSKNPWSILLEQMEEGEA
jgi:hypothetical protein